MTAPETQSLSSYPPGMTATEVEEAAGLSEHSRRQLERDGLLDPISIGRKKVYPRWQVFALLQMTDPDVAVAEAAMEAARSSKAPPGEDDALDRVGPPHPTKEGATRTHRISAPSMETAVLGDSSRTGIGGVS